jgi:hypothetical protein
MRTEALLHRTCAVLKAVPVDKLVLSLLALAIPLGVGCSEGASVPGEFPSDGQPGDSPVWAVVDWLDYRRLVFYPEPEVSWTSLLDMRLFEGFRPGITFRDARSRVGEPTQKGEDYQGPFWDYERSLGTVRIAHKLKGSVPVLRWWRLEGFPTSPEVVKVFHANVSKHIPLDREHLTVVIMNNQGSPGAFVQVKENQVTSIDWVNNKGSGGTRDGR